MADRWYVIRTFSGHENKVKNLLDGELEDNEELRLKILEILVPTEKVFEVKDGKKKSKTKRKTEYKYFFSTFKFLMILSFIN